MSPAPDTTQLLIDARAGDEAASRLLSRHVHDALRDIVRQRAAHASRDPSAPAPAHEAWLRLVDTQRAGLDGRAHFLTLVSRAMRFMLVDRARARTARRRGETAKGTGEPHEVAADERAAELIGLSDCLDELTSLDPRLGGIASLRFFGGLGFDEMAELTGRPAATLKRDWTRARAWLYRATREMGEQRQLNRSRWREIDEPFARALELAGTERASYLNGLKAGDAELYRAVAELLASTEEADAVLGERVTAFAAPLLAGLTEDDWGDAVPGVQPSRATHIPAPQREASRSPLVVAFSVVALLLLVAAALTLWTPRPPAPAPVRADTAAPHMAPATEPDVVLPETVPAGTAAAVPAPTRAVEPSNPVVSTPPPVQPSIPPATLAAGREHRRSGRIPDAERTFRQVLASRMANGAGTLEVAAAEWELGDLLRATGRYDEAGRLLRSSLATRQRLAPSPSADVARTLAALALVECEQGRTPASDSLRAQAAQLYGRLPAVEGDSSTPLETAVAQCR